MILYLTGQLRARSLTRLLIIAGLCLVGVTGTAQTTGSTDGTTPLGLASGSPAGSYPLSDFDSVNLFNGSLNFNLPLLKVGGRGAAGYTMTLHVEQKWTVYKHIEPGQGAFYFADGGWWSQPDGWRLFDVGRLHVRRGGSETFDGPGCGGNYIYTKTLSRVTVTVPDGTEYELRDQLTNGQPHTPTHCSSGFNRGRVFVTADGTSATYVADTDIIDAYIFGDDWTIGGTSGYLMLRDGTRYRVDDGKISWMRDRNGNKVTFNYDVSGRLTSVTDSLNRQITISYPTEAAGFTEIAFKGFAGKTRKIKIGQTNLANALRSDQSPQTVLFPELDGGGPVNPIVVNYVELPDGRRYELQYNSYAELARVVLPTGGAIEYDYAAGLTNGAASGVFSANDPRPNKYIYRRVIERRLYPNGGSGTSYESRMMYSRPETTTTNLGYVITEERNANGDLIAKSQHYFHGSPRASFSQKATDYPGWQDGREYQTEVFDVAGTTVLRRVTNSFAQRQSVSWWTGTAEAEPPNDVRLTETITTIEPSAANLVSKQAFGYDDFNNQTNLKEYDFGSGTPGTLLRETRTSYITSTDYTGTNVHLRSLTSQVAIHDGAGVERARTVSEYDNYTSDEGVHAPLLARSMITGLCDGTTSNCQGGPNFSDTSYVFRGNVTKVTRYLLDNAGNDSGSISNHSQYDVAGNVVKVIDPRSTPANVIATTFDFRDNFGGPADSVHLNGQPTNTAPGELGGLTTYAFPFAVTNPVGHTAYSKFDYQLDRAVAAEDSNGVIARVYLDDALDRPTQLIRAANQAAGIASQATFAYDDASHLLTTTADQTFFNDNVLKNQVIYDGLGRTIETRQYESGENYIVVRTQYDEQGRAHKVSNPFRPWNNESPVWTTTGFDDLDRVISVTTPDGAIVNTAYSGDLVLVTDQAGKQRISRTNALSQLKDIWEVTPADSATENLSFPGHAEVTAGYRTTYAYDTLDKLTGITQGSQTRSFVYDSLERLHTATNPESGRVCYGTVVSGQCQGNGYDESGNLKFKTDARGVLTTNNYDALNRVVSRTHSDGTPTVNYSYDQERVGFLNRGRLTTVSTVRPDNSPLTSVEYDYDPNVRVRSQRQTSWLYTQANTAVYNLEAFLVNPQVPLSSEISNAAAAATNQTSITYLLLYSYNLAGAITTQTYPSGHFVSFSYDSAGRANNVSGTLGDGTNRNYTTSITYSPFGGVSKEQFGTDTPIFHNLSYNSRGQLAEIRVRTINSGADNWNRGSIVNWYSPQCGGASCSNTNNNGNLRKQEVVIPHDDQSSGLTRRYQQYDYDPLNRLKDAREFDSGNNQLWQQEFVYDRWGNRTIGAVSGIGVNGQQFSVDPTTNRLGVGAGEWGEMQYDDAGNLTYDNYTGQGAREYDGENRMTRAWANNQWQEYTYDGEGRRVGRKVNGVETWQVYSFGGRLLAEYAAGAAPTSPRKEYGYRNGELLISASASEGDPPPPPQEGTERTNVALPANGATASASSSHSSNGYQPSGAINGDRKGTNWGTSGGWNDNTRAIFPDWLQVDFNGTKTIDEIDVFTLQDNFGNPAEPTEQMTFTSYGITDFEVQYWNGTNWAMVPEGSVTGNNKVWRKLTFTPIATSKSNRQQRAE